MQRNARESRETILLIDNDQFVAGCLQQYLAKEGWEVAVAADRAAAEEHMSGTQFGVIVVDPYLTGPLNEERTSLLALIRDRQPSAAMVVLTGYGSPEIERAAAQCGAALLTKPQPVITVSEAIVAASQPEKRRKRGSKA